MRQIVNLNQTWAFTKNASDLPKTFPKNWDIINLPHTWNAADGQDGGNDYYRGLCHYAKNLLKKDLPEGSVYYLEFNGTNSSADVFVNGVHLGHHDGGYSTWRVNITDVLKEENLILVSVDNSANDFVYPQHADFTFYGGIYRDVRLIAVSSSHFSLDYYGTSGLKVTPEITGTLAAIHIETYLTGTTSAQQLTYRIFNADGSLAAETEVPVSKTSVTLSLEQVRLWNGRKDPYLYSAEVILSEHGHVLDNIRTRFGCRTFRIDPQKGFFLNGNPYPLRGVSRHQDRFGIGNALLPEHHREDMALIRELGATTIRLAHYQHDRYFYDLCDEYGLIVWAEIPYISTHMPGGRENTFSQMKELIVQNYNHPSIIVWGLSNEITMGGAADPDLLENHRLLNDLCHAMDPTRPTTMACISMVSMDEPYVHIPDTVSYNHYFGWYGGDTSMNGPWFDHFHKKYPDMPIGCSEYGCEALNWHTSEPKQGDYTEEYQAYYHEELIKQLFTRDYLWATHVWNMFDFGADARNEGGENGQNHKGLVTFDRSYKKDSFYAYKAWLTDPSEEPFVHLCGKRYLYRTEDITRVTVYSNLPEVELFCNGISLGTQKSKMHFFYFDVPNHGRSELTAIAGSCKDTSVIEKTVSFYEPYRLAETGTVLNWFDITAPEGFFSLNDLISDLLETEDGKLQFTAFFSQFDGSIMGGSAGNLLREDGMMQMLGGFTILRMLNLLGAAGVKPNKEQLLHFNQQLNRIKKN